MSHDDLVDSTVMALMRFRQGGFIRLPTDEPEETKYFKHRGSGFIKRLQMAIEKGLRSTRRHRRRKRNRKLEIEIVNPEMVTLMTVA